MIFVVVDHSNFGATPELKAGVSSCMYRPDGTRNI